MAEIDEPVDLNLINVDQYNKEVEKIKKAESLAIKAGVVKRKLAAGVAPIQTATTTPEPIEAKNVEGPTLPKGFKREPDLITGGVLAAGKAPVTTQAKSFKQSIEEDIAKKFGLTDKIQQKAKQLGKAGDIVSDPVGFVSNNLEDIFKLAGPVALATIGFQLFKEAESDIEKEFEAGGIFDIRKYVLNASKAVPQLNTLINISQGSVFFTADAGQRLRQVAPEMSNTRILRNEHMRYIVDYQGT